MAATVHQLPARENAGPHLVTKAQLARELGRSERWVELRAQEGMKGAGLDRAGRRLFDLAECQAWLDARSARLEAGEPISVAERLEALEAEVRGLRAEVQRLGGVA